MFDLVGFTFEIFKNSGLFDDVVGKLLPLHVAVAVDVDFVEKEGQISHKCDFSIRDVHLPEFEVLFGDADELLEVELVVPFDEFLFEEVDGQFVEVEGHVCHHFLVGGFYSFVGGAWGVDWDYVCGVAIFAHWIECVCDMFVLFIAFGSFFDSIR